MTSMPRKLIRAGAVAAVASALALSGAAAAGAAPTASASVANNTLTVLGTNDPDTVAISSVLGDPNGLVVTINGNAQQFDRTTFANIVVSLNGGDDQFTMEPNVFADELLTLDAGNGDDVVVTGDGNDTVFGGDGRDNVKTGRGIDVIDSGRGRDFVDGDQGNDTGNLGGGADVFQWDPGDGSDLVNGGSDNDTLLFNGAVQDEIMSLSPNGSQSVFLRNLGNIRMDMTSVEKLDLKALGGADDVTINDMSGTSFREANVDLGGADLAVDDVIVNATDASDRMRVETDDGSTVDVKGLQTKTHITGAEPTDHLQLNTLDGNDRARADLEVLNIIDINADLGLGQH